MNTCLKHLTADDLVRLADEAEWSVKRLAQLCKVSTRTLERYFLKELGKEPKSWMNDHRRERAVMWLESGLSVKETAARLAYKDAQYFSNDFKSYLGCLPTEIGRQNPGKCRIST